MLNRKYGKLMDGAIVYAPIELLTDAGLVINPTAEQYASFGYLPVRDMPPAPRDGYYAVPTGWTEKDGAIVRTYEERAIEPPTPITRYSGWKMYKALKAEGFGEKFDALMKADIGVMIAFVRPQYFLSNDDDFTSMVAKLCIALGIDDETKERILAASVDEEVGV